MEIIKIGLLGIVGVMLAVQLKSHKPEYGVYVGLTVSLIIFGYVLRCFSNVLYQFQNLNNYLATGAGYLGTLLKVVGITYICEFCTGICKDAGYSSVAGQIEILGKLTVMFAGLPIIFAVIEQIQFFLS